LSLLPTHSFVVIIDLPFSLMDTEKQAPALGFILYGSAAAVYCLLFEISPVIGDAEISQLEVLFPPTAIPTKPH